MSRKLDFSKLKFSDKEITTEEALREYVEPLINFRVPKLIKCYCPICKKEFKEEFMINDFPKGRDKNGRYIIYCEECFY